MKINKLNKRKLQQVMISGNKKLKKRKRSIVTHANAIYFELRLYLIS